MVRFYPELILKVPVSSLKVTQGTFSKNGLYLIKINKSNMFYTLILPFRISVVSFPVINGTSMFHDPTKVHLVT